MKKKFSMRTTNELSISEAYDLFVRKAKIKNLSENTLRVYDYHMQAFYRFIDSEQPIRTINEQTIENYILHLKGMESMKDVTISSYLRTVRSFLYFCMDNDYVESFKITMPKYEKKIKETYTNDELTRLLKKPNLKTCTFTEFRVWTFENFLLGTGCRISSALNLKIGDIDFEGGVFTIRKTKNRKQQIIPLSRTLAEILREYLEIRGGEASDYVFCNNYGEQGDRRTYQQLVQDYNIKRNVNKTSCHLFRHTFAKQWIMSGGDMFRLQKILGHSDLTVTREYVQVFGQDLQIDFENFNPLDRMNLRKERIKM